MPHPIYGPPEHRLSTVELRLTLPSRATRYEATLLARGRSSTQRNDLWVHHDQWSMATRGNDLAPVDALHHLALVVMQDRPITLSALEHGLRGGRLYEEPQLPL